MPPPKGRNSSLSRQKSQAPNPLLTIPLKEQNHSFIPQIPCPVSTVPGAGDVAVVKTKPCPHGSSILVITILVVVSVAQIHSHFHLDCWLAFHKCEQSQRAAWSQSEEVTVSVHVAGQRPEARLGSPWLQLEDAC